MIGCDESTIRAEISIFKVRQGATSAPRHCASQVLVLCNPNDRIVHLHNHTSRLERARALSQRPRYRPSGPLGGERLALLPGPSRPEEAVYPARLRSAATSAKNPASAIKSQTHWSRSADKVALSFWAAGVAALRRRAFLTEEEGFGSDFDAGCDKALLVASAVALERAA